ncbi:hypothetical protein BH09VER1_BH09VER1_44100 [soil metagenome]
MNNPWSDDDVMYREHLAHERHLYAWCLVAYGGLAQAGANAKAEEFYVEQSIAEPMRCLVFHDEAWHWAMLRIFGNAYWITRPGTESPSPEYKAEAGRIEG